MALSLASDVPGSRDTDAAIARLLARVDELSARLIRSQSLTPTDTIDFLRPNFILGGTFAKGLVFRVRQVPLAQDIRSKPSSGQLNETPSLVPHGHSLLPAGDRLG
jgi:hypothetical protein